MILELADECAADFIITGNTNDFTFANYKTTKIVTPKAFWDVYPSNKQHSPTIRRIKRSVLRIFNNDACFLINHILGYGANCCGFFPLVFLS